MAIKPGTAVRQIVNPVRGQIAKTQFNESHQCLEYLVEDANGGSRWFLEAEIEPDAATAEGEQA